MSRQLLARAWAAGAGPGDSPLTIDLDSTICETYGLAKEGARHHGPAPAAITRCWPLPPAARAPTARGERETVGRVCYGGARGQLTVRADSGWSLPPAGKWMSASLSPSASPRISSTRGGLDSHSLLDGLSPDVPDQAGRRAGAAHCHRPGSQLSLFARYSYHAFITWRRWNWKPNRRQVENAIRDLKYEPHAVRFAANGAVRRAR